MSSRASSSRRQEETFCEAQMKHATQASSWGRGTGCPRGPASAGPRQAYCFNTGRQGDTEQRLTVTILSSMPCYRKAQSTKGSCIAGGRGSHPFRESIVRASVEMTESMSTRVIYNACHAVNTFVMRHMPHCNKQYSTGTPSDSTHSTLSSWE
jgi:hypothetical protein